MSSSRRARIVDLTPRQIRWYRPCANPLEPNAEAILLVGGDKSDQWATWCATAIAEAERFDEDYLDELDSNL